MQDLISVIIPVYNVGEGLPECLDSVCSQTYRDLEIILVDDGSTDGSGQICDDRAAEDPRILVIHQENKGVSGARNAGLLIATGEYIGFVDGDDRIDVSFYSRMLACLKENDADAVTCGYIDHPYGEGNPVRKGITPHETCGFRDAVQPVMERNGYFTSVSNKLYRRSAVEQNGEPVLMDTSLDFGEDEVWLLQVLKQCRRIAFLPEALYEWIYRVGSVTRTEHVTKKQLTIFKAKEKTLSLLPEDRDIQLLARGRIYNDCHSLKVRAYCTSDRAAYRQVTEALRPMKRDWLRSKDPPGIRKIKFLLTDAGMKLRLPVSWIQALYSIQRR